MHQSSNCMRWLCTISDSKSELQRQGVTVNNHICEHTRVKSYITWFVSMKSKLFNSPTRPWFGLWYLQTNCILASCWNDFVLEPSHAGLVTTTTWGISKKMVLTQLYGWRWSDSRWFDCHWSNRYNLYTKITGGQRVDMFGATSFHSFGRS